MIALDPNQTVEIVLTLDKDNPTPATFICRYLTCRQMTSYRAAIETAAKEEDDEKACQLLLATIMPALTGWKNIDKDFDTLDEVLTPCELWELAREIPIRVSLGELDKKKLLWQSQRATGKDASTTGQESASIPLTS